MTNEEAPSSRDRARSLASLLDALPLFVAYFDADERCCYHNQRLQRWMSPPQSHQSVEGQRLADVLAPAAYALVHPHLAKALSGQAVDFEFPGRLPSGDT